MSEPTQITGPSGETWNRLGGGHAGDVLWVSAGGSLPAPVTDVAVSLPVTDGMVDVSRIAVSNGVGIAQLVAILQAELRRVIDV